MCIETVSNDANGKIKFSALEYKRGEEGTHVYTVEEVQGNDATVAYDKMVATVVVSVTKDGKVLTVTSQLPEDTEFNNTVITTDSSTTTNSTKHTSYYTTNYASNTTDSSNSSGSTSDTTNYTRSS